MSKYDHKKIERKWQKEWESADLYRARDFSKKKKFYVLVEFPYPSGAGLHVGHVRSYTALDAVARKKRMQGFNVLYPMGWDAFGLPTENYAIKMKTAPQKVTRDNIKIFKKQLKSLGLSFDWSREINTTDPKYYKWTQWIFLKLLEKGLAYKAKMPINWCPSCKIGLANEEVINDKCERCGTQTEKREKEQWILKITAYAEKLLNGLKTVDYLEKIKTQQINWIGKSQGAEINFPIVGNYNFVLLHGFNGSSKGIFFPWLKQELIKKGYKCFTPDLPNPEAPKEEDQVNFVLKNTKFDQNTVLFGHSLGAVVALKVLEKLNVKIAGLVLAGGFLEHKFKDKSRPFDKTFKWQFNFEKIKKNCGFVNILSAKNDFAIPIEQGKKLENKLSGNLSEVKAEGDHFTNLKEPEILKNIIPSIKVFTTRLDTLFGSTYLVLAPEHKMIYDLRLRIEDFKGVENYINKAKRKSDIERTDLGREKTGVELKGIYAINPATGKKIPIWCADYALFHYGTGAIMAVPAHDDRDFEFAKKFELPIIEVVSQRKRKFAAGEQGGFEPIVHVKEAYGSEGILVNSGKFNGMENVLAKNAIIDFVSGKKTINYKLRDWVFSRQHYWGEPIPVIFCDKCGVVPVSEKDLPVKLPEVKHYEPTETGQSPLAAMKSWVNVKCPKCGGKARRETDTMPNWAGDSWYFLRYIDPDNDKALADFKKMKYWMPIDLYNGGMEHTTLHLLYSRFWNKFLYDCGVVPTSEPYAARRSHGMVLAEDGQKMSKSRGNVINPDEIVNKFGADTLRLYEMFMGPFNEAQAWSTSSMIGMRRFLERIFTAINPKPETRNPKQIQNSKFQSSNLEKLEKILHKTIKKVTEDIDSMKFNTAIAAMMIFMNELQIAKDVDKNTREKFLIILSPFAPHIAEELWEKIGNKKSIFLSDWPEYDRKLIQEDFFDLIIQINGKMRDKIKVEIDISKGSAEKLAKKQGKIQKYISGKNIKKVIFVPKRLINIVV